MAINDVKLNTFFKVTPHPEAAPDEVYFSNCVESAYDSISWKTKRWGQTAYDTNNKVIRGINELYPVFVKRHELIAAGFTLKE